MKWVEEIRQHGGEARNFVHIGARDLRIASAVHDAFKTVYVISSGDSFQHSPAHLLEMGNVQVRRQEDECQWPTAHVGFIHAGEFFPDVIYCMKERLHISLIATDPDLEIWKNLTQVGWTYPERIERQHGSLWVCRSIRPRL